MNKKIIISIFLVILVLTNLELAYAESISLGNMTVEEKAAACLDESRETISYMLSENFKAGRINDSLNTAESVFIAQESLKEKKKPYDFSIVLPYCEEIEKIKEDALESGDELIALKECYNSSKSPDINYSSVDEMLIEIENEIENERFENVKPLVDKAYEKIINLKSENTTLGIFYKSTTLTLRSFFEKNWKWILGLAIAIIILLFVYKRKISKLLIQRQINKLEIRKNTLKELIETTQKDYFEKGSMSEGNYSIRTKKYAEMIRDIDRQVPLLKEQLFKIDRRKESVKNYKPEKQKKTKPRVRKRRKK